MSKTNATDRDGDGDDVQTCGVDGCDRDARFKEVGDGHALPAPRWRCYHHQPTVGLWRDLKPTSGQTDD